MFNRMTFYIQALKEVVSQDHTAWKNYRGDKIRSVLCVTLQWLYMPYSLPLNITLEYQHLRQKNAFFARKPTRDFKVLICCHAFSRRPLMQTAFVTLCTHHITYSSRRIKASSKSSLNTTAACRTLNLRKARPILTLALSTSSSGGLFSRRAWKLWKSCLHLNTFRKICFYRRMGI